MILAIFNSFAVPVEMTVYQQLQYMTWYLIIDLSINFFFIIDIGVCFNTSYYNAEGEEVRDRKEIAKRYMFRGLFIFDLLSSIPYDIIALSSIKVLKILKILRISRLNRTINKLELDEVNKAVSGTINILTLPFHLFRLRKSSRQF